MGSKNNPGVYDPYDNAEPDEPMFVLLGRDPMAWFLVSEWAAIRERLGEDPAKVAEARECAQKMWEWAAAKGKQEKITAALAERQDYISKLEPF